MSNLLTGCLQGGHGLTTSGCSAGSNFSHGANPAGLLWLKTDNNYIKYYYTMSTSTGKHIHFLYSIQNNADVSYMQTLFGQTITIFISPLMASEVQSGRAGNNCDHTGEAYCKAAYRVDIDQCDIDVAAQTQIANVSVLSKFISAPFAPYDDKLVASYLKHTNYSSTQSETTFELYSETAILNYNRHFLERAL